MDMKSILLIAILLAIITAIVVITVIWPHFINPSLAALAGALGAVSAATIAGIFAINNLSKQLKSQVENLDKQLQSQVENLDAQLRTTTRNAVLNMIISNNTYSNHINEFIKAVYENNIKEIKSNIASPALFLLFIRKPNLKEEFDLAISAKDCSEIRKLTLQLFGE